MGGAVATDYSVDLASSSRKTRKTGNKKNETYPHSKDLANHSWATEVSALALPSLCLFVWASNSLAFFQCKTWSLAMLGMVKAMELFVLRNSTTLSKGGWDCSQIQRSHQVVEEANLTLQKPLKPLDLVKLLLGWLPRVELVCRLYSSQLSDPRSDAQERKGD